MNFKFSARKATEVASLFIQKEGGRLNVMKLVKLVYLLDRLSIERRGIPVVGGIYYSMRNGPVTSELLDIINAGALADEDDTSWEKHISDRDSHEIGLIEEIPIEYLSDAECQLLDELYQEHGQKNQWELRDWCHRNCPEWTPLENRRERIYLGELAENVGKSKAEVEQICQEANESSLLDRVFSRRKLGYG